jgi:AhpD family alkylhydroperoxidase
MIKYIQPIPMPSSQKLVDEVYQQIKRDFGLVGDIFKIHAPSVSLLTGVWASFRETELTGDVPRGIKEAVALAVSKVNQCPFCMDAHRTILAATGKKEIAEKINNNQIDDITDEKMRGIVIWALATRSPGSPILSNPPFTVKEAPEIIGTAVINHYINRIIDVLLTNKSLLPINNSFLNKLVNQLAAPFFSFLIKRSKKTGDSLRFLSETELPKDLYWAQSHSVISRAFASFAAATEDAGNSVLPTDARFVVEQYIKIWEGKDPGLSRNWVEQATQTLTGLSKTIAKLSLLTAIAPYQIDDDLSEDDQLLNLLSWSSFITARKIGTWLLVPNGEADTL